jgi:hypothetical protein
MPRVGFELAISVFERAKTVHALDCVAAVVGMATSDCIISYNYLTVTLILFAWKL